MRNPPASQATRRSVSSRATVRDITRDNFGLLIAYLLPGFVALWGVGYHVDPVGAWLRSSPPDAPTVGGFLYGTLGSVAAGLVVSAARCALLDPLFARCGLRPPSWNSARFAAHLEAFEALVSNHYRYYQFYANTVVAVLFTYLARLAANGQVA